MTAAAADAPVAVRPITRTAAKQAWMELPVRIAALVAAGVVVVVLSVGTKEAAQSISDRRLMSSGTRVTASLDWMEGASRNANRMESRKVRLSYLLPSDPPNAERRKVEGFLTPMPGQLTSGETKIDLYVDPNDPARWTDRADAPSWLHAMAVPLLLLPLAIVTIGATLWQRARVLALYRTGKRSTAGVVESHRSALVPSGRIVKLTPANGAGRVLGAVWPNRRGEMPARGEHVDVIVDNTERPRRVLLAAAYEG